MTEAIEVYLSVERGRQGERTSAGIGATVLRGEHVTEYRGYGYASDQDFPRAYAVHQILEAYPQGNILLHTSGLTDRLANYERSTNGLKRNGKPFVGAEHLEAIRWASNRLTITKPPGAFLPVHQRSHQLARQALMEVEANPKTMNYVPVVFSPNHILDFREVSP